MLLTVNNLRNVRHDKILLDIDLVTVALHWLDGLNREVSLQALERLRDICAEVIITVERKRLSYINKY